VSLDGGILSVGKEALERKDREASTKDCGHVKGKSDECGISCGQVFHGETGAKECFV
jgi:hypothetical protein